MSAEGLSSGPVFFDRRELDQILRVYGRMVAQGEWRDYAIAGHRDLAEFAVFRRAGDAPAYRIEKRPALQARQGQCLTEADGGSDPASMKTKAEKVDGGYRLNGGKYWITNSPIADLAVVWAKLVEGPGDEGVIRGFIVERGMDGFTTGKIGDKLSLRASITGDIGLNDVIVPDSNLLPGVKGLRGPFSCLNKARYGIAWGAMGAAEFCFHATRDYVAERQLFGLTTDGRVALTPLGMIIQFLPLVLLFGSMFFMRNPTAGGVNLLYWAVVGSIGAGLGIVFLRYTDASIASTFFVTAAAFGGLSLFGYTTRRDLGPLGTFLIMGVIGLVIASLVFMFLPAAQNPVFYFAINAVGVLLFSGLIAYDTQRLKLDYYRLGADPNAMAVMTGFGALSLFINFVNLFQFLLAFMGNRE